MSFVGDGVFSITLSNPHFRIEFPECELDETDTEPCIIGWTDDVQAQRESPKGRVA
ncbi:hypothetical protein AA18895_2036 [Acetobacter ghanensis DSM 18895]|nr:hypothetical protein AA18895_2036 [Acetobacter ghanensis DSM 18895]